MGNIDARLGGVGFGFTVWNTGHGYEAHETCPDMHILNV